MTNNSLKNHLDPEQTNQTLPPKQETQSQKSQPTQTKEIKKESPKEEQSLNQSFWIILFFVAGLKDLLEFIFGLIPVIGSILIWIVSFLLGGLIILFLFLGGNYKKLKQTQIFLTALGQLGDLVPVLNILPLSLLTIFIIYQVNKNKKFSVVLEKIAKSPKISPKII
ncbi:MAG: hypothetical protein ACP5OX_02255 [Minisyncoccia bacterium]